MATTPITRNNTIDEWRINTNLSAEKLDTIETGNFTKSNGTLALTQNSSLVITSEGTALQVSNNVLFQSGVQIGKDVSIGVESSATGNVTIGGVTTIRGPGLSLQVANNALVNSSLQVTKSIVTGNVTSNNDVSIGNDLTVGNVVTISGTSQVLNVYSGSAFINTATLIDTTVTNTSISNAVIGVADITSVDIITADILGATIDVATLGITTIDVATSNVSNSIFSNVQTLLVNQTNVNTANVKGLTVDLNAYINKLSVSTTANVTQDLGVSGNIFGGNVTTTGTTKTGNFNATGSATVGSNLTVTSNVQSGNIVNSGLIHTNSIRATGIANVGSGLTVGGDEIVSGKLNVTGNTTTGNLVTSGLVHAGNIRTTGRADVQGILTAGSTTLDSVTVNGPMTVKGNLVLQGASFIDSNEMMLRANTPQPIGQGYDYFGVNRGSANNAYIRWNEPAKFWDIRDVDNGTSYSKIVTANLISDSITSTSSDTIASSKSANTLNDRITSANTSLKAYVDGTVTTNYTTAINNANTSMRLYVNNNITSNAVSANSYALTQVNSANTSLKAYVDGTVTTNYTNAVNSANTSLKSYVDGTFFPKSGGTVSGNLGVTGNLSVLGTLTYIESQELMIGDNQIVLNADLPPTQSPSQDSGIEINRGSSANVKLLWNESIDKWTYTNDGIAYSNIASESSVTTANTSMKSYVDGNITTVTNNYTNAINSANTSLKAYVDGTYLPKSGGTISGNLGITGNLNVSGTVTYINTTQLEVGDNIIVLNADIDDFTPGTDAGIEVNRGIEPNTRILWNETSTKWTYTNDGTNYNTIASGEELTITRNHANSAYASANNVAPQIQPAFDKANTANLHAVSAYNTANTAQIHANAAYNKANTAPDFRANNTIVEYEQFINMNYTITAARNALSAGPITINNGFTVTISDSSNWTIV